MEAAEKLAAEYGDEHGAELLTATTGSYLENYDDFNVGIFNSTTLDCNRKFKNFFLSYLAVQRLSDVPLGQDAFGNITRLDNAIAGLEKRLQGAKDQLDTFIHDQENAKSELGKPFPQEEELRVKSARLIELDTLLNMDERGVELVAGEEYGDADEPEEKLSINAALNEPLPPHEKKDVVTRKEEVR